MVFAHAFSVVLTRFITSGLLSAAGQRVLSEMELLAKKIMNLKYKHAYPVVVVHHLEAWPCPRSFRFTLRRWTKTGFCEKQQSALFCNDSISFLWNNCETQIILNEKGKRHRAWGVPYFLLLLVWLLLRQGASSSFLGDATPPLLLPRQYKPQPQLAFLKLPLHQRHRQTEHLQEDSYTSWRLPH